MRLATVTITYEIYDDNVSIEDERLSWINGDIALDDLLSCGTTLLTATFSSPDNVPSVKEVED